MFRILGLLTRLRSGQILLVVVTAVLIPATEITAQEIEAGAWTITADRMVSFDDPARTVADGNVFMEYFRSPGKNPVTIKADSVTYFSSASLLEAQGDIAIKDGDNNVSASEARINLKIRPER